MTTTQPSRSLLARRRRLLGPSLSLSYRAPLHIVRGQGAYLYDAEGRQYLDCVNNVAHVGHAHPRVVEAGIAQMRLLNTNTRYLHETVVAYAERLTALLPPHLEVAYFTNSGSEANELALRLARTATGRPDVACVDVAYHGNTQRLVEVSPYKFNGPGGAGRRDDVQVVPLPDPYRGSHRGAGARHRGRLPPGLARHPRRASRIRPRRGCGHRRGDPERGGPDRPTARLARRALRCGSCGRRGADRGRGPGGLRSRRGRHVGVRGARRPADIVTMGKPIGNGHPLGAVVTTRPIADAFANGMEYFNTFGGNPVSAAIGLAVLDVIADEGLQEHARVTGDRLLAGLRELQERHPAIGDVRGAGLFVGHRARAATARRARPTPGSPASWSTEPPSAASCSARMARITT